MSHEAPSRSALEIMDWHSWWGDVEFSNEASGEIEYHFEPVAYVEFADGTGQRYQALTVGDLNRQMAHLGIEVECPRAHLNRAECICDHCTLD